MQGLWTIATRLALIAVAIVVFSGCQAEPLTSSLAGKLPDKAILALSVADSCVSVIDADAQTLVGEIKNPNFHRAYSFDLTKDGNLFVPLHGEYDKTFSEILVIDPTTNKDVTRIATSESPYLPSLGDGQYGLVTHNIIYSGAQTDASVIDVASNALLYEIKLDGFVDDVVVSGNFAYIALNTLNENQRQGLLVYDLAERSEVDFFAMPDRPMNIELSKYVPNRVYVALHQLQLRDSYCDADPTAIIQVDTKTGEQQEVGRVVLPTDMVEIDENHLLITESCFGKGKHIRLLDVTTHQVVSEAEIGTDPNVIVKLSDEMVAISIKEDIEVAFIKIPELEVVNKVALQCKWPRKMVLWDASNKSP